MNKGIFISLLLCIVGTLNCMAAEPGKKMTEVVDTFQLGRYVVELSLPKESVIGLAKESIGEGLRGGGIFLDSLRMEERSLIYITDVSKASCTDIGYSADDDEPELMERLELPNKFTVNLFHTPDGYLIEAVSVKYGMSFTLQKATTADDAKLMMPIFESIRILPLTEYDNSKSARRKMKAKLRDGGSQ